MCKFFLFLFSGCIYCFNSDFPNLEISERENSLYYFQHNLFHIFQGIVAIAYYLDLQLPVESAPITTRANVVSSNPAHGEMHLIQHYVIMFVRE